MKPVSKKTILIVDDEAFLLEVMAMELQELGYAVLTAETGLIAQNLLLKHTPDLVITDIRMPDCDGITLLRAIQDRFHGQKPPLVIITTGYSDQSWVPEFKELVTEVLNKPFKLIVLKQTVQRLLS